MKLLFSALLLIIGLTSYSQTVNQIRYDTTKFLKVGGFSEVKIQNTTKDSVGGIFTNVGNGWGQWKKPRAIPGGIVIGIDTVLVAGGGPSGAITALFRSIGTDSVYGVINGVAVFQFRDSTGISLPQLTDSLNLIRAKHLADSTAQAAIINSKLSNITGLVTAGTGATVTGSGTSGSPYVIGASGGGSGTTDSSNVTFYGAVGDGVTDNTTAIQLAFNSHKYIYFPSGVYITSNLTLNLGQKISGYDSSSILKFKTGSTGFMLEAGNNPVSISNLSLFGGNSLTYKSNSTAGANRSGLHVNTLTNGTSIINNIIYGFDSTALSLSGLSFPTLAPPTISGNTFYNSFIGINTARDTSYPGEYARINNNSFHDHRTAIFIFSGNTQFNSNIVVYNGYGVQLLQNKNGGHGTLIGNEINHNTVYGLYAKKIVYGEAIVGNQFFGNHVMFDSCNAINVSGNSFSGVGGNYLTLTLRGGKVNFLKGNYMDTVILSRSNDNFIVSDNYKQDGTFINSTRDLVVDNNFVYTAGAVSKLDLGTTYKLHVEADYAGSGDIPTNSVLMGNSAGNSLSFFPNTSTGATGSKLLLGYFNQTAIRSAVEVANVASGFSNLLLMKGGGFVGIGRTPTTDALEINGNVSLSTAGNKLKIATGTNASIGTATLVTGTVTVSTTAALTGSKIFFTVTTPGGTQGFLSVPTIVNATSFTINSSSATETSTVNWWIIN